LAVVDLFPWTTKLSFVCWPVNVFMGRGFLGNEKLFYKVLSWRESWENTR
jgi:hypothetical protein